MISVLSSMVKENLDMALLLASILKYALKSQKTFALEKDIFYTSHG